MARGGRNKKRFQYCTDSSGEILYLRALQGHSGRNLIDPSLQDNVLFRTVSSSTFITSDVHQFTFHHQFRIDTADSILSACESHEKNTKILRRSTWKHRVLYGTCIQQWKKHQKHSVLGRHQTCSKERIKVLSNAIERHHPSYDTLPAVVPRKLSGFEAGEIIYQKSI